VERFATPVRIGLFAVVGLSLLVAVAVDNLILQIVAVGIAVAAIVTVLALIDRRVRAVTSTRPIGGANELLAPDAGVRSRAIGGQATIVSVVIPGKNESAYTRDCIWSLKNQTLSNF
jgi:hypothetical protein